MSFPVVKDWFEHVLHPRDRRGGGSPWCFETEEWHRAYRYKYEVACLVLPGSILEIGVRYGYSAHAFLCASNVPYVGVDMDDPKVNAMGEPTCAWAFEMLQRTVESPRLALVKMDTQQDDVRRCCQPADLVHVDADHTFKGATRDLERAWELTKRALLVDDYIRIPEVRDATDIFAHRGSIRVLLPTSGAGDALLIKA